MCWYPSDLHFATQVICRLPPLFQDAKGLGNHVALVLNSPQAMALVTNC